MLPLKGNPLYLYICTYINIAFVSMEFIITQYDNLIFFLVIYCFSDTIENKTILHFSMHVAYNSIDTFTIRYTKHI